MQNSPTPGAPVAMVCAFNESPAIADFYNIPIKRKKSLSIEHATSF
jgi:hypothetical protein